MKVYIKEDIENWLKLNKENKKKASLDTMSDLLYWAEALLKDLLDCEELNKVRSR